MKAIYVIKLTLIKKNFANLSERSVICATSNAAVDENASRNSTGFPLINIQKTIKPYSVIRIGPNYHHSLDHISFDNLTITWASENDNNIKFWLTKKSLQEGRSNVVERGIVIYTTLACSGYSIFSKIKKSENIIIDEAAQSIEIDTLIPIRTTCKCLILIGDVHQLPATIFSFFSVVFGYDRSLFKRLQVQKFPVWFLEKQYRMHPQISSFPSRKFYKNELKNSENPFFLHKIHHLRCFGPFIFFDIQESLEKNHISQSLSWCNLDEVRIIKLIWRSLSCLYQFLNFRSIGIITGYNGQIKELGNYEINKKLELKQQVNSVDGFQGKEKDIVFFSCVRSRFERGIGFLSDCRRINVAFTRAKYAYWILGNSSTLITDLNWKEIIQDSQRRSRFFSFRKPIERSGRRMLYWSEKDNENFSFDGHQHKINSSNILKYYKKFLNNS